MTVLPGLFIEYLVIGAVSILWLLPLALLYIPAPPKEAENIALLLFVPVAYVLGMVVDFAGYSLTSPIRGVIRERAKQEIRRRIKQAATTTLQSSIESKGSLPEAPQRPTTIPKKGKGTDSSAFVHARLQLNSPELAKFVELRSSRDRVARGAAMNSLLATIAFTIYFWQKGNMSMVRDIAIYGSVAVLVFSTLWIRYQRSSYHMEIYCLYLFEEKLKADKSSKRRQMLAKNVQRTKL